MEIDQSSLQPLIQNVLAGGSNPVHFRWEATIHVNDLGVDLPASKVIEIDRVFDFEGNYTDYVNIKVLLFAGTYATQIYNYQDNLDISLTQYPLDEIANVPNNSQQTVTTRYQATLRDNGSPLIQGTGQNTATQRGLDLSNPIEAQFQLLDKSIEQVRMMRLGGRWLNITMEDFLKAAYTSNSQQVNISESLKVKGVNIVPPSNKKVYKQLAVPHGIELVSLADYAQARLGGVYSAGLNCYLKNQLWYIYPRYDTSRYQSAQRTATIVIVPQNRYANIERTYRQDGDHLTILATGEVQFRGDSTPMQLSYGNGVRFMDATKVMEGFSLTKYNRTLAARANNNNEFVTVARPTGLNNVQMASNPITANPFAQTSELARRNGSMIALKWDHSNDELIEPDMMVKIYYLQNDTVSELTGVILKAHTQIAMDGVGYTTGRHVSWTALSCFVQNP